MYKDNFSIENITDTIDGISYTEKWKDIRGYEGLYAVSSFGRIKSYSKMKGCFLQKEHILKQKIRKDNGYLDVRVSKGNIAKSLLVHRIVANHFVVNAEGKPQVNHIFGNKFDNFYKHLEWTTSSENLKHSFRLGIHKQDGENHATGKLNWDKVNEIRRLHSEGVCSKELSKMFDVHFGHINSIIANIYWKVK